MENVLLKNSDKLKYDNSRERAVPNQTLRVSSPPLRVCGFHYLIIFTRPLLRGRDPRYTDETRYISGAIPT